ncbi:YutD family protein [Lapidilactobacillus bayanensis]|uniref:YutD family protein n=1 Tax=Lapidilactobacillus bayanensis TaxID=2485998 RepID=UPI001CDC1573|nr:YutD family protein [Lapidilactobacillus bayanensis]
MATSLITPEDDSVTTIKVEPGVFNIRHDDTADDATMLADIKPQKDSDTDEPEYRGVSVKVKDAENILVGNFQYRLVYQYRDGFDAERLGQRFESILNKYDYVVGDWGFEQLRLRGFYNERNHSANRDQNIVTLQDYIAEFCNFGCAFFVLEKVETVKTNYTAHHNNTNRQSKQRNGNSKTKVKQTEDTKQNTKQKTKSSPRTKQQATGKSARTSTKSTTDLRSAGKNDVSKANHHKNFGASKQHRSEKLTVSQNKQTHHDNFTMHSLTDAPVKHANRNQSKTKTTKQRQSNVAKNNHQSTTKVTPTVSKRPAHEFHIRQLED